MVESPPTRAVSLPPALRTYLQERMREGQLELPLLPDVATQTMNLCQSENADAGKLSAVLHRDQALASHVLRVANSPLYMSNVPIVSLQQAVSRLGLKALAEIVIAVSVQSRVFRIHGQEARVKRLWQHSVAAGFFGKEIARALRRNVEGAFLCGLLHDIGKPVVLAVLADWEQKHKEQLDGQVVEPLLDEYHTVLGHALGVRWKLPEQVTSAIRWHHDYASCEVHREPAMVACLADMLAYHAVKGLVSVSEDAIQAHPVVEHLNLYPDQLAGLLARQDDVQKLAEALRA